MPRRGRVKGAKGANAEAQGCTNLCRTVRALRAALEAGSLSVDLRCADKGQSNLHLQFPDSDCLRDALAGVHERQLEYQREYRKQEDRLERDRERGRERYAALSPESKRRKVRRDEANRAALEAHPPRAGPAQV